MAALAAAWTHLRLVLTASATVIRRSGRSSIFLLTVRHHFFIGALSSAFGSFERGNDILRYCSILRAWHSLASRRLRSKMHRFAISGCRAKSASQMPSQTLSRYLHPDRGRPISGNGGASLKDLQNSKPKRQLGVNTIAGARLGPQSKFRLKLGPLNFERYTAFLRTATLGVACLDRGFSPA